MNFTRNMIKIAFENTTQEELYKLFTKRKLDESRKLRNTLYNKKYDYIIKKIEKWVKKVK